MSVLRPRKIAPTLSLLLWDGQRVFLVRRNGGRGLFPHAWTLPGNPLVEDEALASGSRRIAQETLGIAADRVRKLRDLPEPSPYRQDRGPDTLVQVVTWIGDPSARLANWDAGRWVTVDEMAGLRMFREGREVILEAIKHLARPGAQP